MNVKAAAAALIAEGRAILPVLRGEKATRFPNWPTAKPTVEDIPDDGNIAERLDSPLADVDCDCAETRAIAPYLLLKTQRIHGRPSVGASHYWYLAPESRPKVFKDVDGKVLVEIRVGNQQYTLIPPSVLPRKDDASQLETLVWDRNGAPGRVDAEGLADSVRLLAAAALFTRHWPKSQRHAATLAIAGTLANFGVEAEDAKRVLECVTRQAEGEVWSDCAPSVAATYSARRDGKAFTAATELAALLGEHGDAVVKQLRRWWGGSTKANAEVIERYNARFCRVLAGSTNAKNFVIDEAATDRVQLYSIPEFVKLMSKDRPVPIKFGKDGMPTGYKPAALYWLDHQDGRIAGHLEAAPPPLVCSPGAYNLWQKGFAVSPDKSKSWDRMREHLRVVLSGGQDDVFAWTINWLRCLVQFPGELPGSALVWRGPRGAGKGVIARAIKDLFHPRHAAQILGRKLLTGHFNAHQAGKVLLYGDEGVWGTSGEEDRAILQGLITEPVIPVEAKGVDVTFVRNVCHLIMVTNDTWAAPAGPFERRFMVPHVDPRMTHASPAEKKAYFDPLYGEIANGGLSGLLYALMHEGKADLDQARNPPRTEALWQQIVQGMAAPERWWFEVLVDGELPPGCQWGGECSRTGLTTSYAAALEKAGDKKRFWAQELRQLLSRVMPGDFPHDGPRRAGGRVWIFPPLDECRQSFLAVHGFGHLQLNQVYSPEAFEEKPGEDLPF